MITILTWLQGKKTYMLGALGVVVVGAFMFNLIDSEMAMTLLGFLGFGGMISLRSAIATK